MTMIMEINGQEVEVELSEKIPDLEIVKNRIPLILSQIVQNGDKTLYRITPTEQFPFYDGTIPFQIEGKKQYEDWSLVGWVEPRSLSPENAIMGKVANTRSIFQIADLPTDTIYQFNDDMGEFGFISAEGSVDPKNDKRYQNLPLQDRKTILFQLGKLNYICHFLNISVGENGIMVKETKDHQFICIFTPSARMDLLDENKNNDVTEAAETLHWVKYATNFFQDRRQSELFTDYITGWSVAMNSLSEHFLPTALHEWRRVQRKEHTWAFHAKDPLRLIYVETAMKFGNTFKMDLNHPIQNAAIRSFINSLGTIQVGQRWQNTLKEEWRRNLLAKAKGQWMDSEDIVRSEAQSLQHKFQEMGKRSNIKASAPINLTLIDFNKLNVLTEKDLVAVDNKKNQVANKIEKLVRPDCQDRKVPRIILDTGRNQLQINGQVVYTLSARQSVIFYEEKMFNSFKKDIMLDSYKLQQKFTQLPLVVNEKWRKRKLVSIRWNEYQARHEEPKVTASQEMKQNTSDKHVTFDLRVDTKEEKPAYYSPRPEEEQGMSEQNELIEIKLPPAISSSSSETSLSEAELEKIRIADIENENEEMLRQLTRNDSSDASHSSMEMIELSEGELERIRIADNADGNEETLRQLALNDSSDASHSSRELIELSEAELEKIRIADNANGNEETPRQLTPDDSSNSSRISIASLMSSKAPLGTKKKEQPNERKQEEKQAEKQAGRASIYPYYEKKYNELMGEDAVKTPNLYQYRSGTGSGKGGEQRPTSAMTKKRSVVAYSSLSSLEPKQEKKAEPLPWLYHEGVRGQGPSIKRNVPVKIRNFNPK